jgi:hypothetical protein
MEKERYGLCDPMYYVKDKGDRLNGLGILDKKIKVEKMIRKYETSRNLVLIMMKGQEKASNCHSYSEGS